MDITSETCTLLLDVIGLMSCTPAVLITPFLGNSWQMYLLLMIWPENMQCKVKEITAIRCKILYRKKDHQLAVKFAIVGYKFDEVFL